MCRAALAQLKILKEEKVHPSAWIWVHAHNVESAEMLFSVAEQGAWISLDGLREESSVQKHLELLQALKSQDYLSQVLLSHDGNSFPRGGAIRPYEALFTNLIPGMQKAGFTKSEIQKLTVEKPRPCIFCKYQKNLKFIRGHHILDFGSFRYKLA